MTEGLEDIWHRANASMPPWEAMLDIAKEVGLITSVQADDDTTRLIIDGTKAIQVVWFAAFLNFLEEVVRNGEGISIGPMNLN